MNRDVLTVAEAAEELGLTVRGVQYRLKRGLLAGHNVGGRVWLIPRSEVERHREAAGRKPPGPMGVGVHQVLVWLLDPDTRDEGEIRRELQALNERGLQLLEMHALVEMQASERKGNPVNAYSVGDGPLPPPILLDPDTLQEFADKTHLFDLKRRLLAEERRRRLGLTATDEQERRPK